MTAINFECYFLNVNDKEEHSILSHMIILLTNKAKIRKNGANHFRQLVPFCKSSDIAINNTYIKVN